MKTHPKFYLSAMLLALAIFTSSFRFHGFSAEIASLLLESANDKQKAKLLMAFDDTKRFDWAYVPPYQVARNGLPLKEMDDSQKDLVNQLLTMSLSEAGYKKVKMIMSLEEVLAELENNPKRDPEMYFVSIFGKPGGKEPWAWQFDGHHISLHFTVVNGEVSYTPRFLGSNPGEVKNGPKEGLRVLNREEDLAFELLNSLKGAQKQQAVFSGSTFNDIVSKTVAQVKPFDRAGIAYDQLTDQQKNMLWAIVDEYLAVMPEKEARARKSNILKEDVNLIMFGWAGSDKPGAPHYYRIQGLSFLIEFDNSQGNGNHIHTVWRDFDGDFGRDLIKEHYVKVKH
ncbi:DUF3500 domain-containing protein [uncultured Imperialibacter sp.]|uniref:DUF3500 domain-containing protein n=1 Tax=uncultured Imperialibacter sp. TaxID=1672639 RepID=UPI0030DD4C9E|tara:strand:- start:25145 stop:26164 length:1020 start_codon:yes stop_codon:yes gene_type:complete